ncbi:MAG: hypothetical protein WCV50_00885 [Patescibacteria group bacterium]|jgi:hypothetical protein
MKKKFLFIAVFTILGFLLLQIPFTNIVGSGQKFSLFDFFAPAIGMFLASIWGAIAVIAVKFTNALITHQTLDFITIVRFFPLAFAAFYLGLRKKRGLIAIVPIICIILFNLHPNGRGAWFFSLYWLIPVATLFIKRSLVFNSLGATFTAHAVGSVAFLYAFNLPSEVWIALIPVVFLERVMFTGGIALSYVSVNSLVSLLAKLFSSQTLSKLVKPEYTISKKLLSNL